MWIDIDGSPNSKLINTDNISIVHLQTIGECYALNITLLNGQVIQCINESESERARKAYVFLLDILRPRFEI